MVRLAPEPDRSAWISTPPGVRLVNAFANPFDNSVATARTCYSSRGIVTAEEVAGAGESDAVRARRSAACRGLGCRTSSCAPARNRCG